MTEPIVGENRTKSEDATVTSKSSPFRHEDVLALIAEVEARLSNMRETVREHGEDDESLVRERTRLEREVHILEEERSRILARQCGLESQLAEARAARAATEARAETLAATLAAETSRFKEEAARLESTYERTVCASRDARAALSTELVIEFERRATEQQRRAESTAQALEDARAEFLAKTNEVDRLQAAREEAHREVLAARDALTKSVEEQTALTEQLASRDARTDELTAELVRLRGELAALRESGLPTQAASSEDPPSATLVDAAAAQSLNEEEIALAAEARIHQLMAPKVAQLAQAAAFLRKRKERLAALRAGLRRRAHALRALRQIYAQPRFDGEVGEEQLCGDIRGEEFAGYGVSNSVADSTNLASASALSTEREAIAVERQELIDLRAVLAASERALERRAQGTRLVTTCAAASIALAVAGFSSWHLAGAVFPAKTRASVELVATSRAPESKQDGQVDAKPLADEVTAALATDAFLGAVAGRISDRGRTHAEASVLASDLSSRVTLSQEGSTIHLALQGAGSDDTIATLDAVATAAMAELNRRPERRNDLLRIGIANARQEVGRTVFSHAETVADPARIWRAGAILGGFAILAAMAAGAMTWLARRASHPDVA